MKTSAKGRADLRLHEGEVLKAYRDPVGVWTIGVGLTSASGVINVTPGLVITAEESDHLLTEALQRNYEPQVEMAMAVPHDITVTRPAQHEFDGGVLFHFNTGAIRRASWVKAWKVLDWVMVEKGLKLWNKGGGKVLPGLVRRRDAEYQLMRFGIYASDVTSLPASANARAARITLPLSKDEISEVWDGFKALGFDVGLDHTKIDVDVVRAFQRKHDLTVDGILGRATLSTLQRALDARAKAKPAAVVTAGTGGATAMPNDTISNLIGQPGLDWVPAAALGLTLAYGLWLAWRYRDQIAGAIQSPLPRVAAFLRSF